MNRVAAAIAAAALLGLVAVVWWTTDAPPREGPAPVPAGETVKQTLRDADGNPQVWTLTRREVEREELPDLALPAPSPRDTPVDARTDSARALDAQALEAWKRGEIGEAMALFDAAIEADPDDARPRSDYGRLLMVMTAFDRAWPHLERAAQLEPESPQVWVDLLNFYERNQLLERAFYARGRAEAFADGRQLERDPSGLWVMEGDSIFP